MTETTTFLQMLSPTELRPSDKCGTIDGLRIEKAQIPSGELNRFLYTSVGAPWCWIDRLPWTLEEWQACAETPGMETWVATLHGTPVGYFELGRTELEGRAEGSMADQVEILYFGLLPKFIGMGIGGVLLTAAIKRAWKLSNTVERVWVHTCTLDGPHALANYQARGLKKYREE